LPAAAGRAIAKPDGLPEDLDDKTRADEVGDAGTMAGL
jgi:hypothetical protein